MHIAWIYFASSILVLGCILFLPGLPADRKTRITLAFIALASLGRLTREIVVPFDFDFDHIMSFGETFLVLAAIVVPTFHRHDPYTGAALPPR